VISNQVLKINSKGIYAIIIYIVFIVYLGIYYLLKGNIDFVMNGTPGSAGPPQVVLITTNLETLFGIFALAFFIHNIIVGIMKNNEDASKNTRDLAIAYVIDAVVYTTLGVLGQIAVAALFSEYNTTGSMPIPHTVMDLLVKTYLGTSGIGLFNFIFSIIALCFVLVQLTTVIPILCFFTRKQFFAFFYETSQTIPDRQFYAFNIFYDVSCLVVELLALDPSIVISLNGAVCGFFLIYVIPIYLHTECLYTKTPELTQSLNINGSEISQASSPPDNEQKLVANGINNQSGIEYDDCLDHKELRKDNKFMIYGFYGFLGLIGFTIMVAQLYQLITS